MKCGKGGVEKALTENFLYGVVIVLLATIMNICQIIGL